MAPVAVPQKLLDELFGGDRRRAQNAAQVLVDCSLIKRGRHRVLAFDETVLVDFDVVSMHRLVQDVVRRQQSQSTHFSRYETYVHAMRAAFPTDYERGYRVSKELGELLRPHVEAMVFDAGGKQQEWVGALASSRPDAGVVSMLIACAQHCRYAYALDAGERLGRVAVSLATGTERSDAEYHLGRVLTAMRHEASRTDGIELLRRVARSEKRRRRWDQCVRALLCAAWCLIDHYEDATDEVFGAVQMDTSDLVVDAELRSDVAHCAGRAALSPYQSLPTNRSVGLMWMHESLRILEAHLGERAAESPAVARVRRDFAAQLLDASCLRMSERMMMLCIDVHHRAYGDHVETASAHLVLARLYRNIMLPVLAVPHANEAVRIRSKLLGDHDGVAEALLEQSGALCEAGDETAGVDALARRSAMAERLRHPRPTLAACLEFSSRHRRKVVLAAVIGTFLLPVTLTLYFCEGRELLGLVLPSAYFLTNLAQLSLRRPMMFRALTGLRIPGTQSGVCQWRPRRDFTLLYWASLVATLTTLVLCFSIFPLILWPLLVLCSGVDAVYASHAYLLNRGAFNKRWWFAADPHAKALERKLLPPVKGPIGEPSLLALAFLVVTLGCTCGKFVLGMLATSLHAALVTMVADQEAGGLVVSAGNGVCSSAATWWPTRDPESSCPVSEADYLRTLAPADVLRVDQFMLLVLFILSAVACGMIRWRVMCRQCVLRRVRQGST
uniref:Uncharacterized protein n=1 Tax=Bicosoecida sp. CB-2014 TaxID=1486930 RepID=A0A7S1CQA5_9STRA